MRVALSTIHSGRSSRETNRRGCGVLGDEHAVAIGSGAARPRWEDLPASTLVAAVDVAPGFAIREDAWWGYPDGRAEEGG